VKKTLFDPIIWAISFALLSTNFLGCNFFNRKAKGREDDSKRKVVAKVNDNLLFLDEIKGISTQNSTTEDSTSRVMNYIDRWVRKQLLIAEALKYIDIDKIELERKVLDYRYSLIGYEYQNYYLSRNFNDSVSENEIEQYYKVNKDNFILKQNIVRGTYIKLPKSAPRTVTIKKLIFSSDPKDLNTLLSYCQRYSVAYFFSDSVWHEFDKLTVNSPLKNIPDKIQFLKANPYYQVADKDYQYFLRVKDYKILDNVSPLEFVRDDIVNIILNKRKAELIESLEQKIYEKAVEKKYFEIYK